MLRSSDMVLVVSDVRRSFQLEPECLQFFSLPFNQKSVLLQQKSVLLSRRDISLQADHQILHGCSSRTHLAVQAPYGALLPTLSRTEAAKAATLTAAACDTPLLSTYSNTTRPLLWLCILTRIHQPLLDIASQRIECLLNVDVRLR